MSYPILVGPIPLFFYIWLSIFVTSISNHWLERCLLSHFR